MADEKKAWYVLRAISGKEAKVKEVLDAQIRNTDLGKYVFQVLIPTEKVLTVRGGKRLSKKRIFIQAMCSSKLFFTAKSCMNFATPPT